MNTQEEYMEKIRQREIEREPGRKWGLLICVVTAVLTLWLVNWAFADDFDIMPDGRVLMDSQRPCDRLLDPLPGEMYDNCPGCGRSDRIWAGYPDPVGREMARAKQRKRIEAIEDKLDRILEVVE